jgi:hypothetical protein
MPALLNIRTRPVRWWQNPPPAAIPSSKTISMTTVRALKFFNVMQTAAA